MTAASLLPPKHYRLMGPDGKFYESSLPGQFAGNRELKIYGRLDCGLPSCRFPDKGRPPKAQPIRIFFADEAAAIAAGYRPCGGCLPQRYRLWKAGPPADGSDYPWLIKPAA